MIIPQEVLHNTDGYNEYFDNDMFRHAKIAYEKLSKIKEEDYFEDLYSVLICTLERFYSGFLTSAEKYLSDYYIPKDAADPKCRKITETKHKLFTLKREIVNNFDVFPYKSREEWARERDVLSNLTKEYSSSKYTTYPTYAEFQSLFAYVTQEKNIIEEYLNNRQLDKYLSNDEI